MRRAPGITEPFCKEDDRVRLGPLRLLRNFHREQASDHREEAQRINQEADAFAHGCNQQARRRRADDPRRVKGRGVEADG